jgi:mitochondrial chaperone BCS1
MYEAIAQFVQQQLQTNQFFSGGLVLMIAGGVLAYFRNIPSQIWHWVRGRFLIEVDILDRESAFDWLDQWLAQHRYTKNRARYLSIRTRALEYKERQADPTGDHRPRILFTPAPGRHMFLYKGRLVILNRERPEPSANAQQQINVREKFSLTMFTRNRALVQELIEEAREVALPQNESRLTIYRTNYSGWGEQFQRYPRAPESVVLENGMMDNLIADCRWFLEHRDWYLQRGIPYRRGLLLYGPPGTGKSSTVVAIASALRMDIAILNLGTGSLDDNELASLLADLPVNTILLIEDIDCVFRDRKGTEDKLNKITFSGLLNALDGVAAAEGRILFATTNHLERLDPALIRPGRIDRQVEIGFATTEQLRRMFVRFYDGVDSALADEFVALVPDRRVPMSSLQTYLIEHADSPEQAVQQVEDWLSSSGYLNQEWQEPIPTVQNS